MQKHEEKNCPRCNISFECKPGNVVHCQCYGIALTEKGRAVIEERYSDCLCRNCLHEFARTETKGQEGPHELRA